MSALSLVVEDSLTGKAVVAHQVHNHHGWQ